MGKIAFTCRPLADVGGLEDAWRDLESRAEPVFFLSWPWIGCWLAMVERRVLVLEGKADGRIVALGLLCPAEGGAVYLNQTGNPDADRIAIEYNGMLLDRAVAADGARQSLQAIVDGVGPAWNECYLRGLSEEFASAIVAGGFRARMRSRSPTAYVDLVALRDAGQDYLQSRSANTRAQVRRSIRRYEERGTLRLESARNVTEGLAFFESLGVLHKRYWASRNVPSAFSGAFFQDFHRRLIETCLPEGRIELLRLSAGGTEIGYLYNFIHHGTVSYYSSGFVYEDDNRLKPGLVAHTLCIERHIAGDAARYDFMAGEARYKTSLGQKGPEIFAYVLERPGLALMAKRGLRWVRSQWRA